jgi:parallel beta-helix repeat protein
MKKTSCVLFCLLACMPFYCNAASYPCAGCADCSAKISSSSFGDVVLLSQDVSSSGTPCILLDGRSGVSLDCQGHTLADNSTTYGTTAVLIRSGGGNQVRNCRITNYDRGIVSNRSDGGVYEANIIDYAAVCAVSLFSSNHSIVRDNVLNHSATGVSLQYSRNNTLSLNTIKQPIGSATGINVSSSSNNSLIGNDISAGLTGIWMDSGSEGNSLYSNLVCLPVYSTGIVLSNGLNYGDNNTCDATVRYDDACVTGCKNTCSASTTTTTTTSTTSTQGQCPLPGDYPPCAAVSLDEIVNRINEWAAGRADLAEVVNLINVWAGRP